MANPYIGEIRMVGFNFAPVGWALCNGAIMAIAQNGPLYALLGTTYGGDGRQTFGLPDLQGRVPMHQGQNVGTYHVLGERDGTETVTLTTNQIPIHNHPPQADSADGNSSDPTGHIWAQSQASRQYVAAAPNSANAPMHGAILSNIGGGQPHDNMVPFQAINFVICLAGIYPTQG
jgi:microcystin-dependent protein